jgi:hypothetical protein
MNGPSLTGWFVSLLLRVPILRGVCINRVIT